MPVLWASGWKTAVAGKTPEKTLIIQAQRLITFERIESNVEELHVDFRLLMMVKCVSVLESEDRSSSSGLNLRRATRVYYHEPLRSSKNG